MTFPNIGDYIGKTVHMVGVGGSSMSGLAEMLCDRGYIVTGSDRTDGYLMQDVRDKGIRVFIGHNAANVHGADIVVYTAAIPQDNPELVEAKKLGIPAIERSVLLGQLMGMDKKSIGICGAHGKTTTTSMLSQILTECGADPDIHIGGKLDAIGGSTRIGNGDVFVAEACEFHRSFLQMYPTMAVVLNIDADHLDCYRDIDEIEETFGKFMTHVPGDGIVIGKGTDERIMRQMEKLSCRRVTFGMTEECDYHPENLSESEIGCNEFDLYRGEEKLGHIKMQVPGVFNAENAMAAAAAAVEYGCCGENVCRILSEFKGAHRRFELTDTIDGVEIFHDYGHNPTEMRNAISIARKRAEGRVIAVMQPHTFSRVKSLFDEYLTCTEEADVTLVTDICAAREKDPGDINSGMIVEGMRRCGVDAILTPTFDDAEAELRRIWQKGDLVLTMGCGDINMLNQQIHMHQEKTDRDKI